MAGAQLTHTCRTALLQLAMRKQGVSVEHMRAGLEQLSGISTLQLAEVRRVLLALSRQQEEALVQQERLASEWADRMAERLMARQRPALFELDQRWWQLAALAGTDGQPLHSAQQLRQLLQPLGLQLSAAAAESLVKRHGGLQSGDDMARLHATLLRCFHSFETRAGQWHRQISYGACIELLQELARQQPEQQRSDGDALPQRSDGAGEQDGHVGSGCLDAAHELLLQGRGSGSGATFHEFLDLAARIL